VLKAIGARDRDVLRVFLIEAAVVGVVGGALGTLAGWAAAEGVGAVVNQYLASQGLTAAAVVFPSPPGAPLTYVAIGASESFGLGATDPARDAWPQVFYRATLQRAATLVDLGIPGATVADALRVELSAAEHLHPELVTVWLNVNDITHGVPLDVYEQQLRGLLESLRAGGAEVLVANTPPLDRLPRLLQCQPFAPSANGCDRTRRLPLSEVVRTVDLYNEAIARAAGATGAVLVDLHAWGERVQASGDLSRFVGTDGFHPSTAGYRAIAAEFAQAYRSVTR